MELKNFKFKYFNGEDENPFTAGSDSALWWNGEKSFHTAITGPDGDSFILRLRSAYDDALLRGGVNGVLADKTIPKELRMIIFYLDLWHGKWFPYDNLDRILTY